MSLPRRLVSVSTVLLAVSGLFVILIIRTLTAPAPTAPATPRRPVAPPVGTAPATGPASSDRPAKSEEATAAPKRSDLAAYTAIATKNLFNPARTEGTAGTPGAPAGPTAPRPWLHGVVVSEVASIAFLEDPVTKRITAHRVGDALAAGTVQSIAADHVVLAGPSGAIEVRLRDPSKPRPPQAPSTPGAAPPARPDVPPVAVPAVPPGAQAPVTPRPLPPNLLRRSPPPAAPQPGGEPSVAPSEPGATQAPAGPQPGTVAPTPRGLLPLPGRATDG
jgi:hypothetical protein